MDAQLLQVPLASPIVLALRTSAASAKPLLWVPRKVQSDGLLRPSSRGAQVMSPLFFGVPWDSTMADAVAGTTRLFVAAWGKVLDILDQNGGPRPVTPGEAPSTAVAPETLGVTV